MSRARDRHDVSSSPKSDQSPVVIKIDDLIDANSDEEIGAAAVQPSPSRASRVSSERTPDHSLKTPEDQTKRTGVAINIQNDVLVKTPGTSHSHANPSSGFGKLFSALGFRTHTVKKDEDKGHCVISAICKPYDSLKYYSADDNECTENSTEVYIDPEITVHISSENGPENGQRSTPINSRLPTPDETKGTCTLHNSIYKHGKIMYAIGVSGFEKRKDDIEKAADSKSRPDTSRSEIFPPDTNEVHEFQDSEHSCGSPTIISESSGEDSEIQERQNSSDSRIQFADHKDDRHTSAHDDVYDDFAKSSVPMSLPVAWTTPEKHEPPKHGNSGHSMAEIEMKEVDETDNDRQSIIPDSGVIQNNNSDQTSPNDEAHSNLFIIQLPSVNVPEDDVNHSQFNRTGLWKKSFHFLSAFGIRSHQEKNDENQIADVTPVTPHNRDEDSTSIEKRDTTVVPIDTPPAAEKRDDFGLHSDEETETLSPQRPISTDSGVSSDSIGNNTDSDNNSVHNACVNDATWSSWESPMHLHTYFKFMYVTGVTAYQGNDETRGLCVRTRFQKMGFFIICLLSFLFALENLKYWSLQFLMEKSVKGYVIIGLQVCHCLSAVYFFKFAAFHSKQITTMLDLTLEDATTSDVNTNRNYSRNFPISSLGLVLGVVSFVFAFTATQFDAYNVKSVFAGYAFLRRSYDISYALFLWDVKNGSLKEDQLYLEYGHEFTLASVSLGILGSAMELFGKIQRYALRDLMLLAALTLYQKVENFTKNLPTNASATENEIEAQMMKFKHLQTLSENIAHTFGLLITIFHFKNLLLYTFFLLDLMDGSFNAMGLLFSIFDMAKIFATYMISAQASRINQTFLKWIRMQCKGASRDENSGVQVALSNLDLDEIKSEPVGLGAGMSFMSVSSFAKFLGYVVSCFLFFEKKDD